MADNTIAQAYVQIKPSMDGVSDDLQKAMSSAGAESSNSFGSSFSSGLKKAGAIAAGATAAVTAAAVKATQSFVSAASEVAVYGDNIDKMSQKMGISAESYQEWDFVMQHCGTSMETLKSSMKTLANAAENGNAAFEALGITQEEIANMSQEQLFDATLAALQQVEDETTRTYLAGQTLGRGATELGALLNMSAEDTAAMREEVHALGGVLSDEAVASAAGFQDALQNMTVAASSLKNNLMSNFLPALTDVMSGLTAIFSGDSESGLAQISEGINTVVTKLTENLPKLMEVGMGIVQALVQAIMDNLPALGDAALQLLGTMSKFILENLPTLIDVALNMLMTIADGIIDNLPVIIPAVVDVVLTIVDKLTDPDTLVKLIEAALTLIIALAEGLIEALPKLIEKAPVIVSNLVQAIIKAAPKLLEAAFNLIVTLVKGIVTNLPKLLESAAQIVFTIAEGIVRMLGELIMKGKEIVDSVKSGFSQKVQDAKTWGKDLIENFINGIKEKWEHLKETVANVANTVKDFLGFSCPDKGPLSDADEYGPDFMELFASGIRDNIGLVNSAINDVASGVKSDFAINPNISATSTANYSGVITNSSSDVVGLLAEYLPYLKDKQSVEIDLVGGANGLFKAVRKENTQFMRRTGQSAFV